MFRVGYSRLIVALALTAGVFTSAVNEAPAEESEATELTGEHVVLLMDRNRDGKISLDEAPAELKANFGMLDGNQDGAIDADEAYVKSDGSFDAVIVSLLTSDSFIYRKAVRN